MSVFHILTSYSLQSLDPREVCELGSASCLFSRVSVNTMEKWKYFLGVSKVDD